MAITFDILNQFHELQVFQTAKTMNDILKSNKSGSFVIMETVTFQIRNSEKCLFGFNHSNFIVKTEFSKKNNRTLI